MNLSTEHLFTAARTQHGFTAEPVDEATLRAIWDLMKWGPTSANGSPARIVFVASPAAKEKLLACVCAGNFAQTKAAPVTAIVAMDLAFADKLPHLYPHTDARAWYEGKPELARETAFRNSTLQGAYLIVAARALGLDCGPMSGFDHVRVDAAFFAGTEVKSNFLVNLGHGDPAKVHPRGPRLDFDEACRIE